MELVITRARISPFHGIKFRTGFSSEPPDEIFHYTSQTKKKCFSFSQLCSDNYYTRVCMYACVCILVVFFCYFQNNFSYSVTVI